MHWALDRIMIVTAVNCSLCIFSSFYFSKEFVFMSSIYKHRAILFFITLLGSIFLSTATPAHAANTLFVHATSGSDMVWGSPNDCQLSPPLFLPCKTIKHAINQASNGDTIYLNGLFNEGNIILNKNLRIEGGTVDGNNMARQYVISSGRTIVLVDMVLKNGLASQGGAILNNGTLTLIDVNIQESKANQGGGIYNTIEGDLTLESSVIWGTSTTVGEGGAIYNEGDLDLRDGSYIHESEAATQGGAIFNAESGSVSVIDGTILSTKADEGGAIYNAEGGVSLTDASILYSTAVSDGGGIYNEWGTVFITRSEFRENGGTNGGGIYSLTVGDKYLIIWESEFKDNIASENGGGIFSGGLGTDRQIWGTEFNNNDASLNGGALYLIGSAPVEIKAYSESRPLFKFNSANQLGGAIYSETHLTLREATVDRNNAENGGAIFSTGSGSLIVERTALTENSAGDSGGGIYDMSSGTLISVNTTYSENTAVTLGGAIFYTGGFADLANVTLYGNSATGAGGIYTESAIQLHNSIITASSGSDCANNGGSIGGTRNLIDDFAVGACSGISGMAVTNISPTRSGLPAVHTINGLSNAFNTGWLDCPDPLNGLAPLALDQQDYDRLGPFPPCDIGAYEVH